ncbi:efflux RND transporter periplasmic adaptor subunit [Magnetospirillum moscoviense]|uniref:Efflux transporter periplasmic adaptor subunit n=1 Tax=Magnetospirillum moscoviense TaxID=1437059 RepID=A0A178M8P9_9PROT|nr:efflux RND transporter periplasmic adaptor subunit [Magnetospirillum moscoviense]OAN44903.1 efflux transporter periplasmic adaptor subunit [Magnetospirillum moscoviense]
MNVKRMGIMLAGSAIVFGGVLGFVQFRDKMIKDYFANMPKPVIAVTAQPAELTSWQDSLSAVGTLSAVNGVDIAAQGAGLVKDISFQSGQNVKKGQVLLRLDTDVEMADLRSAQADTDLARISANRQRTLVKTDAVSKAAVDKAEAELKVKEAKVAGIRALVDKKSVTAPFEGILGVRKIDLGQYLQPGQAIVNLQDLSTMLADFTVSQRDLAALAPGQTVRMTTDAWPGHAFEGTIAAIEPQVEAKTGMVAAQARFPNIEGRLRPGMFARIEIPRRGTEQVVTVPAQAISYNLHGDALFVVEDGPEGKQVSRVVVELGERKDGRVVIKSGLKPGALVVTAGQLKLEHGSKVQMDGADPLKQSAKAN